MQIDFTYPHQESLSKQKYEKHNTNLQHIVSKLIKFPGEKLVRGWQTF